MCNLFNALFEIKLERCAMCIFLFIFFSSRRLDQFSFFEMIIGYKRTWIWTAILFFLFTPLATVTVFFASQSIAHFS